MKTSTFLICSAAALATLVIGFMSFSEPLSLSALGMMAWALSPYFYLAMMTGAVSRSAAQTVVLLIALLVGVAGVWAMVDTMFILADAQSGLIYVATPVYQWGFLLLMSLPVYFINRLQRSRD